MNIGLDIQLFLKNINKIKEFSCTKINYKNKLYNYLKYNINSIIQYDFLNDVANKIYIILPAYINKKEKMIIEKILNELGVRFDEIICCQENNLNDLIINRNIHYIISDDDKFISRFYDKGILFGNNNLYSNPNVFNNENDIAQFIVANTNKLNKHIKDPITVMSGIPSIDKIWTRNYTIEQSTVQLNTKNIYDYIYSNVCNNLDENAIIYFNNKYTYRRIFELIDLCSRKLKELGINEGDVVTVCMPNTPEAVISLLAINKIGAICLMLHPLLKSDDIKNSVEETKSKFIITTEISENEIAHAIEDKNINIMICSLSNSMSLIFKYGYSLKNKIEDIQKKYKISKLKLANFLIPKRYKLIKSEINKIINNSKCKKIAKKCEWEKEIKKVTNYENVDSIFNRNNISFLLNTGGSTGKPKLAALTNENIIANMEQLKYTIPSYKSFDVIEGIAPIFHGFGLVDTLLTAWSVNLCVDLHPKYDSKHFTKSVLKNKPNLILGPPTLFKAMIKNKKYDGKDLSFLKNLICGSDKLDISLKNEINEWKKEHNAPNPIFIGFGLTECVAAVTFTGLNSVYDDSVGYPLPLNNVKIVSLDDGHELSYNEIGELCINGPSVMKEYYNNNEETNATLEVENGELWLHTGDICSITENGEVRFIDRKKNIIVVSGVNVYRKKIENVVNVLKEVENCAVVGIPHFYKMNVPKVYVVLKGSKILDDQLIMKFEHYCNSRLDKYHRIYEFEQIDEIPLTELNKINYKVLEEREKIKRLNR